MKWWWVVGLVLAGCGGAEVAPEPTVSSAPASVAPGLPVRVTGPQRGLIDPVQVRQRLGNGPGPDAAPVAQVVNDLQYQTLAKARVWAPTAGRCEGGRLRVEAGVTTRCTVTYGTLVVPWQVTIDKDYRPTGRGQFVEYSSAADKFVLRAEAVYGYLWEVWGSSYDELRCSRVPPVRVLPAGLTGDRCQYLDSTGQWQTFRVVIDGDGDVSFEK